MISCRLFNLAMVGFVVVLCCCPARSLYRLSPVEERFVKMCFAMDQLKAPLPPHPLHWKWCGDLCWIWKGISPLEIGDGSCDFQLHPLLSSSLSSQNLLVVCCLLCPTTSVGFWNPVALSLQLLLSSCQAASVITAPSFVPPCLFSGKSSCCWSFWKVTLARPGLHFLSKRGTKKKRIFLC